MSGKKVLTILKIIILLLLMLSVALMLKLNYKKNLKQETSEHIEHTIVYSKAISPMKKAKGVRNLYSSSSRILEKLRSILKDKDKLFFKNVYVKPTHDGLYYIEIPDSYFKSSTGVRITGTFDVSQESIGNLTLLPIFKYFLFTNFKFNSNGITSLSAFEKAIKNGDIIMDNINKIELRNNQIFSVPSTIKKYSSKFDLTSQSKYVRLGNVNKDSNLTAQLPASFVDNINNLKTEYCKIDYNGYKVIFNTNKPGMVKATIKVDNKNSMVNKSTVTYEYNVVSRSTTNNNNNNNNNHNYNYNYNYNSRRR